MYYIIYCIQYVQRLQLVIRYNLQLFTLIGELCINMGRPQPTGR